MAETYVRLPYLNSASTKAEEIAWFEKVKQAAGQQTYASYFFTGPLMSWVEQQIRNDFATDLYEAYVTEQNLTELRRKQEVKDRDNATLLIATRDSEIEQWKRKVANLEHEVETWRRDYDDLRESKQVIENNESDLRCELFDETQKVERLERQVRNLKAKIFDLTNPGWADSIEE